MRTDERTERATPRRRAEVRRRGQVAKSMELSSSFVLLCVLWFLHMYGEYASTSLRRFTIGQFEGLTVLTMGEPEVSNLVLQIGLFLTRVLGPIVLVGVVASLAMNLAQVGFMASLKPITPDLNRLNPFAGLTQIFSLRGGMMMVKALAKMAIVGGIAYITIRNGYAVLVSLAGLTIAGMLASVGALIWRLAIRVAIALFVFSLFDYLYMRWDFERSIRMTKEEVKQEYKQTEGDPLLRARIRARQRQIARRRMMAEVPRADVVITNPVFIAVALRYAAGEMAAPRVVAKGQRRVAERIREIAAENRVPLVENPWLARALFESVELDREVPESLYKAVAEVLAYVYRLRGVRVPAGAGP
jgi:flagellar biosynthetic protein FlhB